MAWFRKENKKSEEDDELEDDEEELDEIPKKPLRRKLRSSDFKDLNPGDRKKRKEPLKPWGRKERWIILTLILLTAGISGFLALSAREYKLPGLPRIKAPTFALPNFLGGETIVIEGNNESKRNSKTNLAINAFQDKTRDLTGIYGLYVVRLDEAESYGVNENEVFTAASLIKLPIMAGLYMEKEEGRLNLNTKHTLKNSDKVAGSGSLQSKPAGYEITFKNIIKLMGQESDNTAFNIARNYLGEERIREIMDETGMANTNLENNETTPKDIGIFLQNLWSGNILNNGNRDEMLSFLTDTIYEDWLAAGVPSGVRVAHKYGRETHVINDAGIIFSDNPYAIVILSKSISDREGDGAIRELSKIIYDIETKEDFDADPEVEASYLN